MCMQRPSPFPKREGRMGVTVGWFSFLNWEIAQVHLEVESRVRNERQHSYSSPRAKVSI